MIALHKTMLSSADHDMFSSMALVNLDSHSQT